MGSTDADCDSSTKVCRIALMEYLDKGEKVSKLCLLDQAGGRYFSNNSYSSNR